MRFLLIVLVLLASCKYPEMACVNDKGYSIDRMKMNEVRPHLPLIFEYEDLTYTATKKDIVSAFHKNLTHSVFLHVDVDNTEFCITLDDTSWEVEKVRFFSVRY